MIDMHLRDANTHIEFVKSGSASATTLEDVFYLHLLVFFVPERRARARARPGPGPGPRTEALQDFKLHCQSRCNNIRCPKAIGKVQAGEVGNSMVAVRRCSCMHGGRMRPLPKPGVARFGGPKAQVFYLQCFVFCLENVVL